MKVVSLYLLFTAILLLSVSFVSAEDVVSSTSQITPKISVSQTEQRIEKQEMLKKLKAQVAEKREIKKASIAAKLTEKRRVNVERFWQQMVRRLEAAIDRLDRLVQRIESRVDKLQESNPDVNTSAIESQLSEAKTKLGTAKAKLAALSEVVETALDSESPKDAFGVVSTGIKDVKKLLKEVHTILVHVIGDVKGLRVGDEDLNDLSPTVKISPTISLTPTLTPTPSPIPTPTT